MEARSLHILCYGAFCFYISWESTKIWHRHTHLHMFKSSAKTWIRIWWAHRERWNASACSVPAQCKQPAHVCACLPPLKLLSISPRCPFLLIQTFVAPATTDAIPPQDFIHKHSIGIPPPANQPLSESSCPEHHVVKKAVQASGESHTRSSIKNHFKHCDVWRQKRKLLIKMFCVEVFIGFSNV